jgi:hypothetical protein
MLVNLKNVSHVAVNGMQIELHFLDSSTHMRRFSSVDQMLQTIEGWRETTDKLEPNTPEPTPLPAIRKTSEIGKKRLHR